MPTLKTNTEKRIRVEERNTRYNRKWRQKLKDAIKDFEIKLSKGDQEEAKEALSNAFKVLDKVSGKGIIPKKRAARRKSKLHRNYNEKFSPETE